MTEDREESAEREEIGHEEADGSPEIAAGLNSEDATSLGSALLRDMAIAATLLSLFAAADSWYLLGRDSLAAALSTVDGLLVGAGLGAICHEWGHFVGARLSGAVAPLRPLKSFFPIFDFEYVTGGRKEFMALSVGGNVGHWLAFCLLALMLSLDTPGQAALLSGAFGFAVFASSVEFPVIRKARAGASAPEALAAIPQNFLQRSGGFGLAAALLMLVIL